MKSVCWEDGEWRLDQEGMTLESRDFNDKTTRDLLDHGKGLRLIPVLEAIQVEEFLQVFLHLWTHFIQLSPPYSFTTTYRSDLCHEWETEGIEFSLREAKTSPGWWCALILLWPLLIFLPPQYLLCFQAYLPLTFWITLLDAFYQSLVCFFVPYYVSPC